MHDEGHALQVHRVAIETARDYDFASPDAATGQTWMDLTERSDLGKKQKAEY